MAYVASEIQMLAKNVHKNNRKTYGIRQMGLILIFGVLLWGWAEISTFIFISDKIGGLLTFLGIFLTGIIGIALLKNQGLSIMSRVRNDLTKSQPTFMPVADSISLVIGGGLILIPGYLTDAVGVLLFIPGLRTMAGMYVLQWIAKKPHFTGFANFNVNTFTSGNRKHDSFGFNEQRQYRNNSNEIIEGEFEEKPDAKSYIDRKKRHRHNDC